MPHPLRLARPAGAWLLSTLITLMIAASAHAAAQNTDFSGAWRLDDRNSDTADALTAAMRTEARKELASTEQQPASPSSTASTDNHPGGGRHGGGGMGGGGMGHGSGMGGGGHGRHGGSNDSKPSSGSDKDPIATATYPMPPILNADSVLLVQQDAKTFQVRLSNGDQLTGKLDGLPHQTLNGNAMVRGRAENGQLIVSIQYGDGTQLDQTWMLSADGQQLVVNGSWKVPTLQQPVTFCRTYVGLH
ncbi:hypothetical protein [Dyella silvae]|uniref:hypothetical protein n=1 Tax=Dyella silvae TaxID=2994424 RepID=UPI0022647D38|nr:hypothetical protein [Dyella silvae]